MEYVFSAYLAAFLLLALMLAQTLYVYFKTHRQIIDLETSSDQKELAK